MTNLYARFQAWRIRIKYVLLQKGFRLFLSITSSRWWNPKEYPDTLIPPPKGTSDLYSSRVFRPSKPSSDKNKQLPLIIQVHGGAFIINTPSADDALARFLADNVGAVVVNIDYRKAPQQIFPKGYEDVVASALALLDDHSGLGIDKQRIAMTGRSAGGNLVLAAAQDPRLRGRVRVVQALYPVCDAGVPFADKMASRPNAKVKDVLEEGYEDILGLYLGPGFQKKRVEDDVRISPGRFTERRDLPEFVHLVGAEHDLLCGDAESMALRLAVGVQKQETAWGWEAGNVKYDMVKGETHGFDVFATRGKEFEEARLRHKEEMYGGMAEWFKRVFDVDQTAYELE
ncbi:hypothetical protein LTR62_000984 [Meristemomyces frigidus]|uniref:Alpha/beta hydrolase fold-3 domain-containing protein n=1 Tax=Meristemomyces frigidus TaxID=1508187 RepID=A0AAN7T9Q8_9PEZI|nr:hypothetical protein LTR62_000984 [Meristemomyces frigidus]